MKSTEARRGRHKAGSRLAAILLATLGAAGSVTACFTDADGRQPVADQIYYPTALVVSPGQTTLYVANSDFDLQYAGGSVQAFDLAALRSTIETLNTAVNESGPAVGCQAAGLGQNTQNRWLVPSICQPLVVPTYLKASAFIGAFASGMTLTSDPSSSSARLFLSVRGDPSITYFDVPDDRIPSSPPVFSLGCNAAADGFCGSTHRLGQDPEQSLRGVQIPADPVGIAATPDGRSIVAAHQTQRTASLIRNDWSARPEITYFTNGLADGPNELVVLPAPLAVAQLRSQTGFTYRDGFVLSYRTAAQVDIVRVFLDDAANPPRPFINRTDSFPLSLSSSNFDSRGLAIVDDNRKACEFSCADDLTCLVECAESIPLQVYVANRNPASLVLGHINTVAIRDSDVTSTPATSAVTGFVDTMTFFDSIPLNFGPSRVEVGQVVGRDGNLVNRVFAVCFDSRSVFVVDPKLDQIEAIVRAGRGPQDVAIDAGLRSDGTTYSHLYIGQFTDSYVAVVDLDRRHATTYGEIVTTLGEPLPPRESR